MGFEPHAVPGWKPGAFPLGDARSMMVQGVGVEPTTSAIIDRAALPTELSLDTEFKLVPGAGVELA